MILLLYRQYPHPTFSMTLQSTQPRQNLNSHMTGQIPSAQMSQKQKTDIRLKNIPPRTDTWWRLPKGRLAPVTSPRESEEELWKKWHPSPPTPKKMSRKQLEASIERLHNPRTLYWNQFSFQTLSLVTISPPKYNLLLLDTFILDAMTLTPRTCSVPCSPRSISQDMVDRMVYRLYQVKTHRQPERVQSCRLKFRFEKNANAGKGSYVEHWIPSPRRSDQERTESLRKLSEKCKKQRELTENKLREKYLQPLVPSKKIIWNELSPKLERMHEGRKWDRSNTE